jgi:hypothetical protein
MLRFSQQPLGACIALALSLSATVAVAEMPALDLNGDVEAGKEVAMNRA